MAKFHVAEGDANQGSGFRVFSWDVASLEEAFQDALVAASRSDSGNALISRSQDDDSDWTDLYEIRAINSREREVVVSGGNE